MFLEAGKHVCVEYPMTLSYKAAAELWDLAQKKGVILHEEHIELLTEDYKQLKKEVDGKVLLEGSLHFTVSNSAIHTLTVVSYNVATAAQGQTDRSEVPPSPLTTISREVR
ncbi:hypothetical protein ATANTOWER_003774 [Ataeniobius toweri]|uniref:Uncharacterized protein n=1 Tax=Ataeniobius toweri TaxID=208326 RepID=A0ABU7C5M8_9TELE|nr:hypothetical protein [Ataeniobius toweri]